MEESEQSYSLVPVTIDLNNATFIQVKNESEDGNKEGNVEVSKDSIISLNDGNQWFKIQLDNVEEKKEVPFIQIENETETNESEVDGNVAHVIVLEDGTIAYLQSNVEESTVEENEEVMTVKVDKKVTKKKEKTFPCTEPGCNRSYTSHHHMKVHLRNHTGDRPYKCEIEGCDKAFATDYSRKAHERTHTGEKPYPCPFSVCFKSFKTSGDLQKHIRTHTGERPFTCPISGCGKTFTTSNIRKIHLRTHTGEKPYLCTYEGCGRRFASSTNYKNHLRIHSGEKPYFCRVENCGRKFTEYSSLYKHHLVHSQVKNYRCFFCGKTYRQLSTLNTHKRTIHGVISAEDGTEIILEQMRVGKDGSKSFKNITSNLLSLKKDQTAISTLDGNVYIISEDDEVLNDFKIEEAQNNETEVPYDAIILRSST